MNTNTHRITQTVQTLIVIEYCTCPCFHRLELWQNKMWDSAHFDLWCVSSHHPKETNRAKTLKQTSKEFLFYSDEN